MNPQDNLHNDPRLTAYALDELEPEERAVIAAQVAADPQLQVLVEELQAEARWLEAVLSAEDAPSLGGERTAQILATTGAQVVPLPVPSRGNRSWARAGGVVGMFGALAASTLFFVTSLREAPAPTATSGQVETTTIEATKTPGAAAEPPDEPLGESRVFARRSAASVAARDPSGQPPGKWGGAGTREKPAEPNGGPVYDDLLPAMDVREPVDKSGEAQTRGSKSGALSGGRLGARGHAAATGGSVPLGASGVAVQAGVGDAPRANGGLDAAGGEVYREAGINGFVTTVEQPETTFSIDVDTASYSNVRRFLQRGQLPPPAAVRVEELVNYFQYNLPEPEEGRPIGITVDVTDAPWNAERLIARVALKGRAHDGDRGAANLVFLIDVSGSMGAPNRLPLVKESLRLLLKELHVDDRVALVVYAGGTGVVLPPTPAGNRRQILSALDRLEASGGTNGAGGIQTAYQLAKQNLVPGGINRVILATDGDFNVGITDRRALELLISEEAKSGVYLTVLGFGMDNLNDATLETLADRGNGHYAYIDRLAEAKKVLVDELSSTLVPVANDVKVQLEFNPAKVAGYRLLGYENRRLANRDFANDKKDAGEMGAGHAVTMLYELIPARGGEGAEAQARRYQRTLTPAADSGELFAVRVRYKAPGDAQSQLVERPVHESSGHFRGGSEDLRFATAVAAFGLLLKGQAEPGMNFAQVAEWARGARGEDLRGLRREFVDLVQKAERLAPARVAAFVEESSLTESISRQSRLLRACGPKPERLPAASTIELRVAFDARGVVDDVRVLSAPSGTEVWSRCLAEQIQTWRIPANGLPQAVIVPIVLGAGGY